MGVFLAVAAGNSNAGSCYYSPSSVISGNVSGTPNRLLYESTL